jgi:MGT family glycosyltransferase
MWSNPGVGGEGDRRTFLFVPESAYGPTNNCVGIGAVLRDRGHRVVFAAEASWRGRLSALGFEEDLVDLAAPAVDADGDGDAGRFWKEFIRDTAPEFRKPPVAALATFMVPTWQALVEGVRFSHDQLSEIVARTAPDVVVEDNVVAFPALLTAGVPWVRIVSCNPLEVPDPALPPAYSGLPADDERAWAAFRAEYDRTHRALWREFDSWVRARGAPALPDLEFVHTSAAANLYVYPEVADYRRSQPLDATWHRLESSVRATDEPWAVPAELTGDDRPLVYLSLGSLGSADVELMRRLVGLLADAPYRFVVSKGPQHGEYDVAANMWGAEFLPQTRVLPHCDAVITHGGNNTTTEALHFGKPMVVLPLFWDQHDNAQRMDELGYGVRLDPYRCSRDQLVGALDRLLADTGLRERMAANGAAIRARDGKRAAADVLERVAT